MGQRLRAVEQRTVALEFGDVAEERGHLRRLAFAGGELRHRGGGQPDQVLALPVIHAQQHAFHHLPGVQRTLRGQFVTLHLAPVLVDDVPAVQRQLLAYALVFADPEDAHGRAIAVLHHQLAVVDHDPFVDGLHQFAVAHFREPTGADVACDRDDALASVEVDVGRMHFHREPRAVAPHVGDFDDVGLAAVQRFPDRHQVVARKVRIEHVDVAPDDLLAWPLVGLHAGLVEVQHRAVLGDDADRVGYGVEQVAVARTFGVGLLLLGEQGVACLPQEQGSGVIRAAFGSGALQRGDKRRQVETFAGRVMAHVAAASALPTRLPVSRPSRVASQRPVSASRSRSTPVRRPWPCSR